MSTKDNNTKESISRYYRKKLVLGDIEVEYSSEENEISVVITRRLVKGDIIGTEHFKLHPSYVEPLTQLLNKVTEVSDEHN